MNTFKNFFGACNGTRIAQCSLLIALAFLFLAIVFMCVFYNLNALATNNIAFAEDDLNYIYYDSNLRTNVNGGNFSRDNLVGSAGILAGNTSDVSFASVEEAGKWYCSDVSNLTISKSDTGWMFINNSSSAMDIIYWFDATGITFGSQVCISCGLTSKSTTVYLLSYNITSQGLTYNSSYQVNPTSFPASVWYNVGKSNFSNVLGIGVRLSGSGNVTISYFKVENGQGFTGQPSNSFLPNGYDVGYSDGQNAGGSADPDYSVISSTGIVRDNIVDNNDAYNWNYNVSVGDANTRVERSRVRDGRVSLRDASANVYTGTNFSATLGNYSSGAGSLIGNTLSSTTGTTYLFFNIQDINVIQVASTYTLTFGISHVSGDGTYTEAGYIGAYKNGNVIEVSEDFTENTGSYISLTFDTIGFTAGSLSQFGFAIFVYDNSSVDIDWIKLEQGDSFSGYVPKTYKLYGYNDGYDLGYETGYSDAFVYSLWTKGVGVIPSDLINDNVSIVTSDYVSSVSALSVDNQAHTYSPPAKIGAYIDFSTIPAGASLKFDCTITFTNVTSSTIHYYFADADYNDANWLYNNSDGSFANGSSDFILVCPRIASRLYFVSYVSQTLGFQVAGLPYYKVFDFKIENENGNNIISSIVLDLDETFEQVRDTAYENGLRDGKIIGESSHEYSFMSLFGAIYDVPVNAFNNMFNFDVFGVNFRAILLGLITLALGLFIWKIIVRGG